MSDLKRPFPAPPFVNPRAEPTASVPSPFGPPTPQHIEEEDPRLKDDGVLLIFKQFLRSDQISNTKLLSFILKYVTCRNVQQAGREADLSNPNYWKHRPEVHACIDAITQKEVLKYGYDGHDVIERAKEITNIDPIVLQNPDGSFKTHLSEIPAEARRAIKKFKAKNMYGEDANGMRIVTGQLVEVEFWDKMKGLELLGPEKNVFKKTTVVQHDVTNNMKDVLLESGNRADERMRLLTAREVGGEVKSSGGSEGWSEDGVPVGEPGGEGTGD